MPTESELLDSLAGLPPLLPRESGDLSDSLVEAQRRDGGAAFLVPARTMNAIMERICELQNIVAQNALTGDDAAMWASAVEAAEAEARGG